MVCSVASNRMYMNGCECWDQPKLGPTFSSFTSRRSCMNSGWRVIVDQWGSGRMGIRVGIVDITNFQWFGLTWNWMVCRQMSSGIRSAKANNVYLDWSIYPPCCCSCRSNPWFLEALPSLIWTRQERRAMTTRNLTALPKDFVSEKWMESRSESTFWSKVMF